MQEPHGKGVRANSSDGKQGSAGCGGGAYRYGRSVAEVISDTNLSLALVDDGQAFAYRQYLSGCNAKAQQWLRQGHSYLDGNGDGEACESLR